MDHLLERLEALEHQVQALHQETRTVKRRLRWWRGLAGGLVVLGLLTWALPVVTADDAKHDAKKDLEQRVAALEKLLKHFRRDGNEVFIKGANLHIVNGLSSTDCEDEEGLPIPDCPNGLGNLIVGYNEPREPGFGETVRTGSHNVVVGQRHNFSRFGGLVVGDLNEISGIFAVVSGGTGNTASGAFAVVSGGRDNTAAEVAAVVSGGSNNTASDLAAVVSDGSNNRAISQFAAVSGGQGNTASGDSAVVSGGHERTADGEFDWVAGSLFEDE
jgi:hypothetical protein